MKRVKAACLLQTLVFSQKPDMGYSRERALIINHDEIEHYKKSLEKARTRYQIVDEAEQEDGSIIVHVRKAYNDKAAVDEYFVWPQQSRSIIERLFLVEGSEEWMQGEITLDMVKRRIRYLYEHHPDIHLNYHIRSKIQLENIPATIVGVYPHLFVVSESGHGYDKQCSLKYTDVLIGQIEIAELN